MVGSKEDNNNKGEGFIVGQFLVMSTSKYVNQESTEISLICLFSTKMPIWVIKHHHVPHDPVHQGSHQDIFIRYHLNTCCFPTCSHNLRISAAASLPSSSSPTSISGSAPLHLHSVQVPRCTGILQFVHACCADFLPHHSAAICSPA